jgi:hypothetical protein
MRGACKFVANFSCQCRTAIQCGIRALNVRSDQSVDEVCGSFEANLISRADIGWPTERLLKECGAFGHCTRVAAGAMPVEMTARIPDSLGYECAFNGVQYTGSLSISGVRLTFDV